MGIVMLVTFACLAPTKGTGMGPGTPLRLISTVRTIGSFTSTLKYPLSWYRPRTPISRSSSSFGRSKVLDITGKNPKKLSGTPMGRELRIVRMMRRSEEHTSELQSHHDLVCRLL